MLLGSGGPVLLRLYFIHGGRRMWLATLLQNAGFPLLLVPLSLLRRRPSLPLPVLSLSLLLGLLFGLDCYLYSYGSSALPLSTSSILVASQLAFTAAFAFLLVRQRFTAYSLNSVVLLTLGPVVLGLGANGDRPAGESEGKYYLGFFMTVAASALIGLILPLMERMYGMVKEGVTYGVVMEIQMAMGLAATAFCLVGMIIDNDFQAIPREAREYGLGQTKYYLVLIWDTIFWQLVNIGLAGIIACSSSLLCAILIAVLLPVSELLAVIFIHEKFNGSKGVALVLCLWGFASYLYGERKKSKKVLKQTTEVELPLPVP